MKYQYVIRSQFDLEQAIEDAITRPVTPQDYVVLRAAEDMIGACEASHGQWPARLEVRGLSECRDYVWANPRFCRRPQERAA